MGLAFSRLWERMFGKKEMRILMVSGKLIQLLLLYAVACVFVFFVLLEP